MTAKPLFPHHQLAGLCGWCDLTPASNDHSSNLWSNHTEDSDDQIPPILRQWTATPLPAGVLRRISRKDLKKIQCVYDLVTIYSWISVHMRRLCPAMIAGGRGSFCVQKQLLLSRVAAAAAAPFVAPVWVSPRRPISLTNFVYLTSLGNCSYRLQECSHTTHYIPDLTNGKRNYTGM